MDYLTAKEMSEVWGIKPRMVMTYCQRGSVPGVLKKGGIWLIPKDSKKPVDGRTREGKKNK